MKTLIIYSSHDGQTKKIAATIANRMQPTLACDTRDLSCTKFIDWPQYNAILIGAPIRYGHFPKALHQFIIDNLAELRQRTSAFFSVNLTARKKEKCTPQSNPYTVKFLARSPWEPDLCAVFAGALRYPHYRWSDRMVIQFIMWMTGGVTDTKREVEYTDWSEVDAFADQFAQLVAIKKASIS